MLATVGLIAYFGSVVFRDVYRGIPASIPVSALAARCESVSPGGPCETTVVALNPGRFRVATSVPASSVTIQVSDSAAAANARWLLVRSAVLGRVIVEGTGSGGPSHLAVGDVQKSGVRYVFGLPAQAWDRVIFTPSASDRSAAIDELGFFGDARGLLRSETQPFPSIPPDTFVNRYVAPATVALCAGLVVAGACLRSRRLRAIGPWLATMLCLAVCTLEVGTTFSPYGGQAPYGGQDLRSYYASEWLPMGPDSNLTGGLSVGSRLVQGLGATVRPDTVQWHRMPGYGLFCALGAVIGRTTDVIEIAAIVVLLQILFYSVATGIFVAAAQRVFTPWVAWLLGVMILQLPKQLGYTQPDSIIVPIQLLVLAAILVHLAEEDRGQPTLRAFLLVNLAFALWFFMRNDILPGWLVISFVLANRRWRLMAIPLVLIAAIALPWALYKQQYSRQFDVMPTNAGEVLLLGLCEVPGAFPYECTDEGYYNWARRAGHLDSTTNRASMHAAAEVVRHWATYPVHFGFMVLSKARRAVTIQSFPGFNTRFNRLYRPVGSSGLFVVLLIVMATAIVVNYQRRRTILLGWAVCFNMPMFFVTYSSSGRFYPAAGVGLLAATIPLLCDREFYRAMAGRSWRAATVVACLAAFVAFGPHLEHLVMTNDALHYWTPWLDPGRSTLRFPSR
jgi:hypothetical protein